jgi:integrase
VINRTPKVVLRAAHRRGCPNEPKTSLESIGKAAGCGCQPRYYTFYRDGGSGKPVKAMGVDAHGNIVPVGRLADRQLAERQQRRLQTALEEGRVLGEQSSLTFAEWIDQWLASHRGGPSTINSYRYMARHAKQVMGSKLLRDIRPDDVQQFLASIREAAKERGQEVSESTQAKHLRGLKACLQAAIESRHLQPPNPAILHKSLRPKQRKSVPSYFTDDELPKLLAVLDEEQSVYKTVFRLALHTGLRQGELLELRSGDVHLLESPGYIEFSRKWDERYGVGPLKDKEPRRVWLTDEARRTLEAWTREVGVQPTAALVFQPPRKRSEHLNAHYLRRILDDAMEKSGVGKTGERGNPRNFHSFRHTFARMMLERGAGLEWVSLALGHSSILLTKERYGRWSREGERKQAERVAGLMPAL